MRARRRKRTILLALTSTHHGFGLQTERSSTTSRCCKGRHQSCLVSRYHDSARGPPASRRRDGAPQTATSRLSSRLVFREGKRRQPSRAVILAGKRRASSRFPPAVTLAEESFCNRNPFLLKRTAARRLARTLVPIRGIRRIAFLPV